jgi:hypothetical protein
MNPSRSRRVRRLAAGVLSLSLLISPAARAQDEPAGSESKGRPYDGYIATFTLACLALFIVGKTARR